MSSAIEKGVTILPKRDSSIGVTGKRLSLFARRKKEAVKEVGNASIEKCFEYARDKQTPCLIFDLEVARANFDALQEALPHAEVYYAVKANSEDRLITALDERGSRFDVASRYEIEQLLQLGISPEKMSFGNTIKKEKDIAYAYEKGIRVYTSDSVSDVEKISRAAPGASVIFRLLVKEEGGAAIPLSAKFGAEKEEVKELILHARARGLTPLGVLFHVGSQQRDPNAWEHAIADAKEIFVASAEKGINLTTLNLGGGFPSKHRITPDIAQYGEMITGFLEKSFGGAMPKRIAIEPGRFIAGDAGVLVSEVISVSRKKRAGAFMNQLCIDGGIYSGLEPEIEYNAAVEKKAKPPSPNNKEFIVVGPTCDSTDTLRGIYEFPEDISPGDRVAILAAGAYLTNRASPFNGFPVPKTYLVE